MLAGLKNTYRAVAVRHVHPWYSWAILSATMGFVVGVAYVANQQAQFQESDAAMMPSIQDVDFAQRRPTQKDGREITDLTYQEFKGVMNQLDKSQPVKLINGKKTFLFDLKNPQKATEMKAMADRLEKSQTPYEISLSSGTTYTIGVKNRVTTIGVDNGPGGCFFFSNNQTIQQGENETEKFDAKKYHVQSGNSCGLTSLANMDIDTFGIDLFYEMVSCADSRKIPWIKGVTPEQFRELLSCKLSLLAKRGIKASFTTNNFVIRENHAFNSLADEKSPCKDIANTLKSGGGVIIRVLNISSGVMAHYTQVHKIDCARGTMTLNDQNGSIVNVSFDEDGKITAVEPKEADEIFKGVNIISYTTETKK